MKRILVVVGATLVIISAVSAAWFTTRDESNGRVLPKIESGEQPTSAELRNKLAMMASVASVYCATQHFNTQYCFFADMSMPSGAMRLFVYDLKRHQVQAAGLVAHGRCNQDWLTGRKYGNTIGCGCTSLGRYKIGHPYQGRFGLAYKLYGLDTSNSNAYNRYVVLHSHECVPDKRVDPSPICQSDGCPTVAPGFLKELAAVIDKSPQPVLLWMYE